MLPESWIDALFERLSVRYGAAFLRQWPDANPAAVKADWATVLDGCSGHALSYALENLPADRPINALQFRVLCRQAPAPQAPALPAPKSDPARVQSEIAKLRAPALVGTMHERVEANIRSAARVTGRLSMAQRAQLIAMGVEP